MERAPRLRFGAVSASERHPGPAQRLLRGRPRAGPPRAAAVLGRPRHERDAQVDPGPLRRRGRVPDRQPRPARRGLRGDRGARRGSSARARSTSSTRARSSPRDFIVPAIKANAHLRRRLPAVHRARPAADREARGRARARQRLRHDRPRLHRQGQRPGPHRGHDRDARAGAEGDRAGALVADGPRGGDRLRPRARHPGQGGHRGRRRTRSTTTSGAAPRRAAGSRTSTTPPRTTSSSSSRARRRRPTSPSRSSSASSAACR